MSTAGPVHDVLVVGAGPAGAGLALRLARAGRDVLLLERSRFPREKLCGEFVSPDALASLEELEVLSRVLALEPPRISTLRVTAGAAAPLDHPLGASGLGVSRRQLDAFLATAAWSAGALLIDRCRVLRVARRPAARDAAFEAEVLDRHGRRARHAARALVDATGRRGLAAEGAAARRPGRGGSVGLSRHHVPRDGRVPEDLVGRVELHVFSGGYCGVAAIEEQRVNVCTLISEPALRQAGRPAEALRRAARENPWLARRLDGLEPEGSLELASAPVTFDRRGPASPVALEIGDAAAMIAPACGDGMAMALRSAEMASDLLERHLDGRATWNQTLAAHRRAWRAELASRLRIGRAVHWFLTRPRAATALLRVARAWPGLVDRAVRGTRDWSRALSGTPPPPGPAA